MGYGARGEEAGRCEADWSELLEYRVEIQIDDDRQKAGKDVVLENGVGCFCC